MLACERAAHGPGTSLGVKSNFRVLRSPLLRATLLITVTPRFTYDIGGGISRKSGSSIPSKSSPESSAA